MLPLFLLLLESLVEAVRHEAGEEDYSQDENYRWKRTDYQDHVIDEFYYGDGSLATGRRCLHHPEEVFECPEAERHVPVDAERK